MNKIKKQGDNVPKLSTNKQKLERAPKSHTRGENDFILVFF